MLRPAMAKGLCRIGTIFCAILYTSGGTGAWRERSAGRGSLCGSSTALPQCDQSAGWWL